MRGGGSIIAPRIADCLIGRRRRGAKRTGCQNEMNVVNLMEQLKILLIEECSRRCHEEAGEKKANNLKVSWKPLFESVERWVLC